MLSGKNCNLPGGLTRRPCLAVVRIPGLDIGGCGGGGGGARGAQHRPLHFSPLNTKVVFSILGVFLELGFISRSPQGEKNLGLKFKSSCKVNYNISTRSETTKIQAK